MYVTSRPDFQKMKVMAWLAEHNFPYGLVTFGNGISKDLQRHKTEFLRYLVNDVSNILVYYINTSEIPSELSRENFISSHVKITCYLHT